MTVAIVGRGMLALGYTVIPTIAVILGAAVASVRRPGDAFISAMQHLAAGVVFAAAATEILPQVMHQADPVATFVGAALGVALMLALKSVEARFRGPAVLLGAIGVDIFVDGLVLGLAFVAGAKAGILLTFALTLEVLFLGVVLTTELGETIASRIRIVLVIAGLALFMPLGALTALPVATFSAPVIAGFLSFGLMALLYLVTEELLVEAHTKPDSPLISAMFFAGFLGLLLIEEALG
jgi:ZIP family zinc transporter